MRGFVVDGYVQVQTHLPDAVHEAIFNRSEGLFAGTSDPRKDFDRNPQNNIVPMIPELRQVLEAPEVVGALTSILGPDYLLHPHRHCHPQLPRRRQCRRRQCHAATATAATVPMAIPDRG